MTIESIVSGEVLWGFRTDQPSSPATAITEMTVIAATTFLFMVLILKNFLETKKVFR
jgi:preprotein translocase subunit SecG